MIATPDTQANASRPIEKSCADCRFGAGFPQGPKRLMRCVDPDYPTVGQFLRGPVACTGFQACVVPAADAVTFTAPVWAHCGDCEFADLFTFEPACACSHPVLGEHRPVRRADAPVCASFSARRRPDLTLRAGQCRDAVIA